MSALTRRLLRAAHVLIMHTTAFAKRRSERGLKFAALLFVVAIAIAGVHVATNTYGFDPAVVLAALLAGVASTMVLRVLYVAERREENASR